MRLGTRRTPAMPISKGNNSMLSPLRNRFDFINCLLLIRCYLFWGWGWLSESGLWGWKCKSSITEKENCALRCLSSACYQLIYESDPVWFHFTLVYFILFFLFSVMFVNFCVIFFNRTFTCSWRKGREITAVTTSTSTVCTSKIN